MAVKRRRVVIMPLTTFRRGRFPVPDEFWEMTPTQWSALLDAAEIALHAIARDEAPLVRGFRRAHTIRAVDKLRAVLEAANIVKPLRIPENQ